jgi:hypothetical protein
MQKHLNTIMQKEMTRKEFLATVGFGVATLFGAGTLIKLLTGRQEVGQQPSVAYGSSAYGGAKKPA